MTRTVDDPRPSLRTAAGLLADRRFRPVVVVGALLSLVTLSDGFLYLVLQRQLDLSVGFFPLLYVATATVYLALAVPLGRLADRVGRGRVFVGGYALLGGVYLILLIPGSGLVGVVLAVAMFGAFYAATEGVLMAMAGAVLPESLRTSGLSVLTTFTSIGRLFASILFGALWTVFGQSSALMVVFVGLAEHWLSPCPWSSGARRWRSMPDPTLTRPRTATKVEPAPPPVSPPETDRRSTRGKLMAMAVITVGCLVLAGGYFVVAARRGTAEAAAPGAAPVADLAAIADQPHLLFLDDDGDSYRRVSAVEPDGVAPSDAGADDGRLITDLGASVSTWRPARACASRPTSSAVRCRPSTSTSRWSTASASAASPAGRCSLTAGSGRRRFVTGHSYSEGGFSTTTILIDMEAGTEIANLEDFTVMKDGRPSTRSTSTSGGSPSPRTPTASMPRSGTGGSTYLLRATCPAGS